MGILNAYLQTRIVVKIVVDVGFKEWERMKMTLLNIYYNTSTHDTILFFTSKGRVFRTKGYQVPEFSRTAKGLPIINLLGVDKDEKVTAMIPVDEFEEDKYFFFVTQNGIAKRTPVRSFRKYPVKWA